mgnify:CR=1 FL=1
MHTLRFVGTVEHGRLLLDQRDRFRQAVEGFNGKRIELTIGPKKNNRSLKANSYLWAGVYPYIAEWSGHDVEEIHAAMKHLHCPRKQFTLPSGEIGHVVSTRTLDECEFSEYVSKVKRWAAENGLNIPDPEEVAL